MAVDRRSFVLGASATLMVGPTACIPIWAARLIVGRSLIRTMARGTAARRAAATATVGRGMTLASRAYRLARLARHLEDSNRQSLDMRVMDEDRSDVAEILVRNNVAICRDRHGNRVMTSGTTDQISFEHYDREGNACGFSTIEKADNIVYFDLNEHFIGRDIVALHSASHYDRQGRLLGTSQIQSNGDLPKVVASKWLARDFEREIGRLTKDVNNRLADDRNFDKSLACRENKSLDFCNMIDFMKDLER